MSLYRYPGNRFDGDTFSDRASVPLTLPNGTTFKDLQTLNEYVLKSSTWYLSTTAFKKLSQDTLTTIYVTSVSTENLFATGLLIAPQLTVPVSFNDTGPAIFGGKLTNSLVNINQKGGFSVTSQNISVSNPQNTILLTGNTVENCLLNVTGTNPSITFSYSGQNLFPSINLGNTKYTPFCILDDNISPPTGISVDFYGKNGQWTTVTGSTGLNLFISNVWRASDCLYLHYPITGVRFNLIYPYNGTPFASYIAELGVTNKSYVPTSFTHALLNVQNIFQQKQILRSGIQISGGNPVPGHMLVATDTLGNSEWRGVTGNYVQTNVNNVFTISQTFNNGFVVNDVIAIAGGSPVPGYALTAIDTNGNAVWRGPTGLSSSSLSAVITVSGIRITSGSPQPGYVLTAIDTSGNTAWRGITGNYAQTTLSNTFSQDQIFSSNIKVAGGNPVPGFVLTATDTLGNATWRGITGDFARTTGVNVFVNNQIFKSGIQISGGNPIAGYSLVATDNLGNCEWRGQTGNYASLSLVNTFTQNQIFKSGVQISGGAVPGYVFTATDTLGNGAWRGITGDYARLSTANIFTNTNAFFNSLQYFFGSPQPGYYLTSIDSAGNCEWRGPTGVGGTGGGGSPDNAGTVYREYYTNPSNIAAQVSVTIPNSRTYSVGSNKLQVFVDGNFQKINTNSSSYDYDYWEQSSSTVRFSYAVAAGSEIGFLIFN